MARPTLLLSAAETAAALDMAACIAAVEEGFRALGEGRTPPSEVLALHSEQGSMHVKAARWQGYFVVKANANFPGNPVQHGLPAIQGVVVLCDAATGELLALMDSSTLTALRTGAATAVAAQYLARRDGRVAAICGCGKQAWWQLQALRAVLPLERVFAFDTDPAAAERFAERVRHETQLEARAAPLDEAVRSADVIVTCTPACRFFLLADDVRPGAFVAAVGADNEHKQEIEPRLFSRSKVVCDSVAQCARMGDLHHALAAGAIHPGAVHADLAEVVAGKKSGRLSGQEITLFDSTGIALEDAAAAAQIYERALTARAGTEFRF
jgi:alanine dehydrogenase